MPQVIIDLVSGRERRRTGGGLTWERRGRLTPWSDPSGAWGCVEKKRRGRLVPPCGQGGGGGSLLCVASVVWPGGLVVGLCVCVV